MGSMYATATSLLASSQAVFDAAPRSMDIFLIFAIVVFLVVLVLEVMARSVTGALMAAGLTLLSVALLFTT